ncbi:DUF2945 domain-containing protein [Rhodococcus indonesiensis]|uniref:DUF2945 domain-containing protein n=1 Tax=Rhodococcus indonesiensis TaxID=3055869 RepID=UPI0039F6FDB3
MEEKELRVGDGVEWNSHGSTVSGVVEEILTADTEAAGRTVRASEDDPQYRVRSDNSGSDAVHKAGALRRHSKRNADRRNT